MALDPETRRLLDQVIGMVVKDIDKLVKVLFNPERKANLQIKNENDFTLGVGIGIIQQTFLVWFISMHRRVPNEQENSEITDVIFKKLPVVRESIFKAG